MSKPVLSAFPITPAAPDGSIDTPGLRRLLAPLAAAGVDSIGLLGSTGSYPYLSREQRRRALDVAMDEVGGRTPVLVGVGAIRTDEAVRIARDARAAGATMGLLAPVSYTPLTEDEVFEHFAAVAREGGLPLCVYDNPATTHFRFTPALLGRLGRVPGVVAVKSPAPDAASVGAHLAGLREALPEAVAIGCSVDWRAAEALIAGASAWYSVAAGLFPSPCLELVRAVGAGRTKEARRLSERFAPLWRLFRTHSSLRVAYAAAALLGLCDAQPPRPILPLSQKARSEVGAALAAMGL